MRNKHGITLVAMVITVIILLILAGITIYLSSGQNGIIEKAQAAGRNYINAEAYEERQLADMLETIDENKGISNNKENGTYGYFSVKIDNNKTPNSKVALNKVEGNLLFDEVNKIVTLEAGKHYYICFSARTYDPNDSGTIVLYNETQNETINDAEWPSGIWCYNVLQRVYTPENETKISIRVTTTNNIEYLDNAMLTIYEI